MTEENWARTCNTSSTTSAPTASNVFVWSDLIPSTCSGKVVGTERDLTERYFYYQGATVATDASSALIRKDELAESNLIERKFTLVVIEAIQGDARPLWDK